MKKYVSCFLFFFFLTSASLITLFLMTVGEEARVAGICFSGNRLGSVAFF